MIRNFPGKKKRFHHISTALRLDRAHERNVLWNLEREGNVSIELLKL